MRRQGKGKFVRAAVAAGNRLCVNGQTRRPGRWCYDSKKESDWRKEVVQIYAFPWDQVEFQ